MKPNPDLESRLRSEARRAGSPPSPHLHNRIMAEVSSLHAEQVMRGRAPWIGIALGTMAVLLLVVGGLHRVSTRVPGRAPALAQVGGWSDVAERATSVSNELETVMANPFGAEVDSLATDARRATQFLADCIPL